MQYWQRWHYKNLTFVFAGIMLAVILSRIEAFHTFLLISFLLNSFGIFSIVSASLLIKT